MKKRVLAAVVCLAGLAGVAVADVTTNITIYMSSYKMIPSSCTNVGVTGLSTGVAYCVFAVTNVTGLTEAIAPTNGDFRAWAYLLLDDWFETIAALPSTNQPAAFRMGRTTMQGANTQVKVSYGVEVDRYMGALTLPAE